MNRWSLGAAIAAVSTVGEVSCANNPAAPPEAGWIELERPVAEGLQRSFYPAALSGDGHTVVGREWNFRPEEGAVSHAAVWHRGTLSWLAEPNRPPHVPPHALAYAINRDGSVIAGLASLAAPGRILNGACVWYDGLPFHTPGTGYPNVQPVLISGISANGSVVVGRALVHEIYSMAFRISGGVFVPLEPLTGAAGQATATGISADGQVVVGFSTNEHGIDEAVRWVGDQVETLGPMPSWATASYATDTNQDGTVVVGRIMIGSMALHFRWCDGEYEILEGLDPIGPVDVPFARSIAVNADGSVIVGGYNDRAFYWTRAKGTRPLRTAAIESGITIPCCTRLLNALDVSDDGKTVLVRGRGRDLVITLGSNASAVPGDVTGNGEVNLADLNLVLANFGQTTPNGDANGDGVVNLADLNLVLANFGYPHENTPPNVPGDVTGDGQVNLADLNLILANFGQTTPNGDANGDGVVNLADLNILLANFGS